MKHSKKITLIILLLVVASVVFFVIQTRTVHAPETANTQTSPTATDTRTNDTSPKTVGTNPATGNTQDMSNKSLREVPKSVFEKRETTILNLSYNSLTSLQAEVRQLAALTVLDLSHNSLTNIPAELGQLSNLEILNLSYNKLTGLPYELGNLQKLKVLDLRGNNYAQSDLDIIRKKLPSTTSVLTDSNGGVGNDAGMENPTVTTQQTKSSSTAHTREFAISAANYSFSVTEIKVSVGDTVTINFSNSEGFHDWVIDAFNARTPRIGGGQTATVTFVANKAGAYEYYCSVGSHRAMGMVGKLVVE